MYKLGYGLQGASICLRCQYRLRLRERYRPQNGKTFQSNRHFVLSRPLKQDEVSVLKVNKGDDQEDVPGSADALGRAQTQAKIGNVDNQQDIPGQPSIKYEVYEGPTKVLVPGKSRETPQMKKRLGYNRLGQPAEVLILRERQKREAKDIILNDRGNLGPNQTSTDTMSSSDVLEEIDAERGVVSTDQVIRNIDAAMDESIKELKLIWQTTGNVVAVDKYDRMASRLYNGFTASQLAAYLAYTTKTFPVDPLDLHNKFSASLYTRSPWTPGTSDVWRIKAPGLTDIQTDQSHISRGARVKTSIRGPHKATLVDEIMRRCWQIRPKEDESALGEMEMQLQAAHLELIVNHKRSILKQISETYGVKVEASTRDRALRVTSDYETCVDILRLLIQTLGNIKSHEVDFPVESGPNMQSSSPHMNNYDTFIREVMQSTNTIIKPVTSQGRKLSKGQSKVFSQLVVFYLGPDDEDMEDARRLISQVLRTTKPKDMTVVIGRAIREKRDLLVPIDVGSGLSLTDRSQQWSRWCSRSMRNIDPKIKQHGGTSRLNTIENPLDQQEVTSAIMRFLSVRDKGYETAEKTRLRWMNSVTYWDSATLGQVVFPTPYSKNDMASLRPGNHNPGVQPRLDTIYREFVTQVPGLVSSLETIGVEDSDPKTLDEEFLLIRLFPSSKNALPPPLLEAVPDLEIRISCNEEARTTSIRDARLVLKKELDLLLPQNTLDLRFTRRRCVYARSDGLDPSIQHFIQSSNLDIWGPSRLKTPTDLILSIPPHALGRVIDDRLTSGFENHDIHFTFASLEHKNEIEVPFRQPGSWADLTYTTIEAGKIGGRRSELSLRQSRQLKSVDQTADDGDVNPDVITVDDGQYSASLLKKANALIRRLEHPLHQEQEQEDHRAESKVRKAQVKPKPTMKEEKEKDEDQEEERLGLAFRKTQAQPKLKPETEEIKQDREEPGHLPIRRISHLFPIRDDTKRDVTRRVSPNLIRRI